MKHASTVAEALIRPALKNQRPGRRPVPADPVVVNDFEHREIGCIVVSKVFDGGRFCETTHTMLN